MFTSLASLYKRRGKSCTNLPRATCSFRVPHVHLTRNQAEELPLGAKRQRQRLMRGPVGEPAEIPGLQFRPRTEKLPEMLAAPEMADHPRILHDGIEDLARVVDGRRHVDASSH